MGSAVVERPLPLNGEVELTLDEGGPTKTATIFAKVSFVPPVIPDV
jgi:hypothetical protein